MAIVLLDTKPASFKDRARIDFGPFVNRAGRSHMYFLQLVTPGANADGGYFNVNARHANSGDNIRTPLITKFFPTTTKQAFLIPVFRIRDTANQRILVQVSPKEFYRGAAETRDVEISLFYEDERDYPITQRLQ